MDFDDFDKNRRKQRFKNKSRKDSQKHNRQIDREKVKTKEFRPKFDYNPDFTYEDDDDGWSAYEID